MGYFCGTFGFFTVFNKIFRKKSNLFKTYIINCLIYFAPCLIIIFINISTYIFFGCLPYLLQQKLAIQDGHLPMNQYYQYLHVLLQ